MAIVMVSGTAWYGADRPHLAAVATALRRTKHPVTGKAGENGQPSLVFRQGHAGETVGCDRDESPVLHRGLRVLARVADPNPALALEQRGGSSVGGNARRRSLSTGSPAGHLNPFFHSAEQRPSPEQSTADCEPAGERAWWLNVQSGHGKPCIECTALGLKASHARVIGQPEKG